MSSPIILGIETATSVCSVALFKGAECIGTISDNSGKSHAQKLGSFIQEVLTDCNLNAAALDAIAISMGPGSYTGLRIGLSLAQGICYSIGKPLIAINTLRSLANMVQISDPDSTSEFSYILPAIDARREAVYSALFDVQLNEIEKTQRRDLTTYHIPVDLNGKVLILGNGALKFAKFPKASDQLIIKDFACSAVGLGSLALRKFENSQFENLAYFTPNYIKSFER